MAEEVVRVEGPLKATNILPGRQFSAYLGQPGFTPFHSVLTGEDWRVGC